MNNVSSSNKIRFGLIGCGNIASRHLTALLSISGACIAGVVDRSPEKAKAIGEQYGVPWYTDYATLIQEGVDVICILTPSGAHAEIALKVLEAGKTLVIEKPMTLQLSDANRLLREANMKGVNIFVVHQYRFHPAVQLLHQAIQQGRMGKITLATARIRWCRPESYYRQGGGWRGTWAMDGGVISNQSAHLLDLLQWLIGPVYSVKAWGSKALTEGETENVAIVVFQFENGAMGILEATTCARPYDIESSLSVLGESGSVEVGGLATNQIKVWAFSQATEQDQKILDEYGRPEMGQAKVGHLKFYEAVLRSLCSGSPFVMDGYEARKTVEIISAIYESIETGEEVCLRFKPKFCRLGRTHAS